MRVLIFGATGLLGRSLMQHWSSDQVVGVGSRDVDIRDCDLVRKVFARYRPDYVVLAAAYTDVDGCEQNPELAHQVNCIGATHVARAAHAFRAQLMLISTDYVFDGEKTSPYEVGDPTRPINVYGRTKAEAEVTVQALLPDSCVVRTSWLFGVHGRCFPETILRLVENQREISVVYDQQGCPTFNHDLARALIRLARTTAQGIIHLTNLGSCSWLEFAQAILKAYGRSDIRVRPVRTEEFSRMAPRPKYSVLSPLSSQKYGVVMRPWLEALHDYLNERCARLSEFASAAGAADSGFGKTPPS